MLRLLYWGPVEKTIAEVSCNQRSLRASGDEFTQTIQLLKPGNVSTALNWEHWAR